MAIASKPPLQLTASCLGPVAKLDGILSKYAQNLIFARNGTGKSFLTRALRYLDVQAQGGDISNAAIDLVAEESSDGCGTFSLSQGGTSLATLSLNLRAAEVKASTHDRIFHVFSEDFVSNELRQRNFDMDGNIESEIRLDQVNIDTKEVEEKLVRHETDLAKAKTTLAAVFETQKTDQLAARAGINKRLKDYIDCTIERVLSRKSQPQFPARSTKNILSDLDALKAIPADPEYPTPIAPLRIDQARTESIVDQIKRVTSPSAISDEIKAMISARPEFFETGLNALADDGADQCPFCQQSLAHPPASEHIQLYIAYFANAEGKHKKELRTAWTDIKNFRTVLSACRSSVTSETLKFESLRKYVPSQREVQVPDLSIAFEALDAALIKLLDVVAAKGRNPGDTFSLPTDNIHDLASTINVGLGNLNQTFDDITSAVKASDVERRALQREICSAFEVEFAHAKWAELSALRDIDEAVSGAKEELSVLRKSQLSASAKERVATTFEMLIRSFFGTKYTFDRADFVLKRDNRRMMRGTGKTLSDGEKTAIAFCYFIACTHRKVALTSDYAKVFMVFDDPITSMSYDFVFSIAQTLKSLSINKEGDISINPAEIGKAARPDLLIFTHSSYFFNICVNNNIVKDDAAFFLHQSGGEHKLSKRSRYVAPFDLHLREIFEVANGKDPDHTTGNAVRCVLEAIGRFCHPDKCDSLSNFIIYLAGDGGIEIKSVLINHMSHGTYYDEMPSPEELREACLDAISIVEKYAKGQLELIRALTTTPGAARPPA